MRTLSDAMVFMVRSMVEKRVRDRAVCTCVTSTAEARMIKAEWRMYVKVLLCRVVLESSLSLPHQHKSRTRAPAEVMSAAYLRKTCESTAVKKDFMMHCREPISFRRLSRCAPNATIIEPLFAAFGILKIHCAAGYRLFIKDRPGCILGQTKAN
nr:hypothetical protein CFP56_58736 [Quercus suber]